MDFISVLKNLVDEIIFENKEIDVIGYFEEIVGYEKNNNEFTDLIAKYIK